MKKETNITEIKRIIKRFLQTAIDQQIGKDKTTIPTHIQSTKIEL